jgi:hypothetical protein
MVLESLHLVLDNMYLVLESLHLVLVNLYLVLKSLLLVVVSLYLVLESFLSGLRYNVSDPGESSPGWSLILQ